jgi:hypothetical protein
VINKPLRWLSPEKRPATLKNNLKQMVKIIYIKVKSKKKELIFFNKSETLLQGKLRKVLLKSFVLPENQTIWSPTFHAATPFRDRVK